MFKSEFITKATSIIAVSLVIILLSSSYDVFARGLVIDGGTLIDGTGGAIIPGARVVIKDGVIVAAGRQNDIKDRPDWQKVDAAGKFLVPGLVDAHTHIDHANGLNITSQQTEIARLYNPIAFLYNGVTSVINLSSSDPKWVLTLRDKSHQRGYLVPRIFAGEHFTVPDGWGSRHGGVVRTVQDVKQRIEHLASEQYDLVKILYDDGLGGTAAFKRMSPDMMAEITRRSKETGLPVFIHAIDEEEYMHAIDVQPRAIVHALSDRSDATTGITQRLVSRDIYVVPTLVLFEAFTRFLDNPALFDDRHLKASVPPFVLNSVKDSKSLEIAFARMDEIIKADTRAWARNVYGKMVKNTNDFAKAGVKIAIGSDAGGAVLHAFQGYSTPRELELLVDCCLTAMQGIMAASAIPAEMMGRSDQFGTIEPGKVADLLILNANPLVDIRHIRNFDQLVVRGRLISRDKLAYDNYKSNIADIAH